MGTETPDLERMQAVSDRWFLRIEYAIYAAIGLLLAVTALVAVLGAAVALVIGAQDWRNGGVFEAIDDLLFVLMLVEILHTVRVSLRSGELSVEPFLIVGLIASIRRVLVITLETVKNAHGEANADVFSRSMIELSVLGGLILIMVASIFVLRRSGGTSA